MLKENIYLGLGSNLGERERFLQNAIDQFKKSDKIELLKVSALYETEPVGFTGQNKYLNLVAEIRSSLEPNDLLTHLEEIESGIGKKAEFKNGPREIDIDILFYAYEVFQSNRLTIPHPGLTRREFALRPLLDLNPDLTEPTTKTPYSVYLKRIGGNKEVAKKSELDFNPNA
jgi:2-amino-4-hydroxy-6-hydroxymethyldihydropteridine diphosphokinase